MPSPFTFDTTALLAAAAAAAGDSPPARFLTARCWKFRGGDVELADLLAFFKARARVLPNNRHGTAARR